MNLRLKFEGKLNDMHMEIRDLRTLYQAATKSLEEEITASTNLKAYLDTKTEENNQLH